MKSLRLVSTSVVVTCLLLVSLGCGQKTSNPFRTEYNGMGKVAEPEDSVEADGMTSGTKEHPWEEVLLEKRLSKAERQYVASTIPVTEGVPSDCDCWDKDSSWTPSVEPRDKNMPKGKNCWRKCTRYCGLYVWPGGCVYWVTDCWWECKDGWDPNYPQYK